MANTDGPKGVWGWLLLFCIALTVFGPLAWIRMGIESQSEPARIVAVGTRVFSLLNGFGLWTQRPPAVGWAQLYLLLACVAGTVFAGLSGAGLLYAALVGMAGLVPAGGGGGFRYGQIRRWKDGRALRLSRRFASRQQACFAERLNHYWAVTLTAKVPVSLV